MKIVVTIPAFNEQRSIGNVISSIKEVMDNTLYDYKILVVDDGSRDATASIAKNAGAIVYSHPYNYGLADAFRTEIKKSLELGADVIVHFDADNQYRASEIPLLLREIENGYDLVLGSRFRGHIEYMPFMKRLGNVAFSRVISNITHLRITDAQTGFRAFTREVAEKISIISNHTYTQEQIIHAVKNKFRIKEVPVYFAKRYGRSRLISSPFEYAAKAWINILRVYRDYEPLKFFGIFGALFFLVGLGVGIWLFLRFLVTGQVDHLPSAVLSMLLMVVGVQVGLFGFLADMKKSA
jgi:glycosyltransferase involved in cell wall biosynthesis